MTSSAPQSSRSIRASGAHPDHLGRVVFAVGLASLDTFTTTRSTELVGMPPGADPRP